MKDALKVCGFFSIGLSVAILIYPFLHEIGHILFAVFSGATINEVAFFPVPYVVCNVVSVSKIRQSIVGMGGMIFPFTVSFFIIKKNFWMWLTALFLKGISLLSFVISYFAILLRESNTVLEKEDIVNVIKIWEPFDNFWLCIILILILICIFDLYMQRPIMRIFDYFLHKKIS